MSISKQVLQNRIPVGAGQYAVSGSMGSDWLLCDGATCSTADYPVLSALIIGLYGSAPGGSFKLPDATGCVLVGFDNYGVTMGAANRNLQSGSSTIGTKLGQASFALTTHHFASHTHTIGSSSHSHSFSSQNHDHGGHGHIRGSASTIYPKSTGTGGHKRGGAVDNGPAGDGNIYSTNSFGAGEYPSYTEGANYLHDPSGVGTPPAHENRQPYATLFLHVKAR